MRQLIANIVILISVFASIGFVGSINGYAFSPAPCLTDVKAFRTSTTPATEEKIKQGAMSTVSDVPPGDESESQLPWGSDLMVESLKSLYGTSVLIAYYQATLHDPILSEAYNISHAANMLAGTVVAPGQVFSQNKCIGPYTKARGYKDGPMYAGTQIVTSEGGGVCKIASVLYNVVTLSNLRVVERHSHSMTVPYVPPGQDATVAYGSFDFQFQNTSNSPILIWSAMIGDTLYIAFYGREKAPLVSWHHETLSHTKVSTIKKYNPSLPPGTETELAPGQEGIAVRSWLTIESPDGKVTQRNLGTDYYDPSPRVVEYGPRKE